MNPKDRELWVIGKNLLYFLLSVSNPPHRVTICYGCCSFDSWKGDIFQGQHKDGCNRNDIGQCPVFIEWSIAHFQKVSNNSIEEEVLKMRKFLTKLGETYFHTKLSKIFLDFIPQIPNNFADPRKFGELETTLNFPKVSFKNNNDFEFDGQPSN